MTPEQQAALKAAQQRAAIAAATERAKGASPLTDPAPDPMALLRMSPAGQNPGMASADERIDVARPITDDPTVVSDVLDNVIGGYRPEMSVGEKIGTGLNMAGEAMTFGLVGDEASAALAGLIPGGMDYNERLAFERANQAQLEQENPGLALGAQIGGAMLMPGAGAVGNFVRGGSLLAQAGKSALVGGVLGGTYAGMEGEGNLTDRLSDAREGGMVSGAIGAAIPVVGRAVEKGVGAIQRNRIAQALARNAPTASQQRAAAGQLYDQIDNSGVQVTPQAFDRLRRALTPAMRDVGLDELPGPGSLTPKAARVNQIAGEMSEAMAQEPTAALPFRSLDQLRRHAGNAAADVKPLTGRPTVDARAGTVAVETIDDFVQSLAPGDVTAGDVRQLQALIPKAREAWQRMSKTQLLEDAMENSDNYLSGRASGIRNQFRRILANPKLSAGFSDAEKALLRRVAQGSIPEQALYLLGGGLGNLGALGVGMSMGPIGTALAGGAALGFRKGAEKMAERNANIARALIASGQAGQVPQNLQLPYRPIIEQLMRQATAVAAPN